MSDCANPIDAAILADYWLGLLPEGEEEAVEEHLLACDSCGHRLREIIALADGVRRIAREGSLMMPVSEEFLQRAAAEGLRIREYAPPAGGSVQCTIAADDDILIGRLSANLSRAKRVDLVMYAANGAEMVRAVDIPFRSNAGAVLFQQSTTYAKAAPSETLIVKMLSVDAEEGDRLLGEYTFHHTRTIPGPAGW